VKAVIKIIFASAFALSVAAPAIAQSSGYGDQVRADQRANRHQPTAAKRARNAFAAETRFGFQLDANSPAATGGGSLGYNQKLLDD
jgi:uncharacterized low-complexity protein